MKKIIDGKKYDTETAVEIGYYSNDLPRGDFRWCAETLYCKRNGEFFMYGEGGGLSPYAYQYPDGGYCEGEKLLPISDAEAKRWCEQHLSYEGYVELFGEPEE